MPPSDPLVDDLADAILDGTPIDWAAAESSPDGTARPLSLVSPALPDVVQVFGERSHDRHVEEACRFWMDD